MEVGWSFSYVLGPKRRVEVSLRSKFDLSFVPNRALVHSTYIPPQVPVLPTYSVQSLLEAYDRDCRRMYVEQPRVRVDGVYIAVCHCESDPVPCPHSFVPTPRADVRAGHSENAWVNVTHLITYHRYLRFMPNGVVLSLLANEDQSPHDVVHYLKPGLKMKVYLLSRITSSRLSYMMVLTHYS